MNILIVCNGEAPPIELLKHEIQKANLVIAADGGAYTFLDYDCNPDVVVGDMDSFDLSKAYEFEIVENPDQETNDLEKALDYALEQGGTHCIIMGAFGKRVDHSLKNLSVLYGYEDKFTSIRFRDIYQDICLIKSPFKATYPVGTTISFIPYGGRIEGIKTKGLKYPLNDEALEIGIRDGTSNLTVDEEIELTFNGGYLIMTVINELGLKYY